MVVGPMQGCAKCGYVGSERAKLEAKADAYDDLQKRHDVLREDHKRLFAKAAAYDALKQKHDALVAAVMELPHLARIERAEHWIRVTLPWWVDAENQWRTYMFCAKAPRAIVDAWIWWKTQEAKQS